MNVILFLVLAIVGISCLIWFRSLAHVLAIFFAKRFRESYGQYATERGWDDPNSTRNRYFYRPATLFIAVFLIIMAFHELFGTIYLNR
jgi:hypothetical protein